MKLHRFFTDKLITEKEDLIVRDKDLINQWRRVLRMQEGSELVLFDGSDFEFLFSIKKIENKEVILGFKKKRFIGSQTSVDLCLLPSLIKKENFELVLEKGTELGVQKFLPTLTERSVKTKLNLERSRKILKEAAEQSGKIKVSEVSNAVSLEDTTRNREEGRLYFALDPRGEKLLLEGINSTKLSVFIGPEGGFTNEEILFFKKNKIPVYSLGKQILRAETAAIAIASIILLGK